MAKSCKDCKNDKGKCVGASRAGSHRYCFEQKEVTNGDRIRTTSDEELARLIYGLGYEAYQYALNSALKPIADTEKGWLEWLAEENAND